MESSQTPTSVKDDVVVSLDYTLKVNNEVVDTTEGIEPITFIQGKGGIIPGLEKAIYGMKVGDTRKVTVSPAEGFGDTDPDAVVEVAKDEFPAEIPQQVGIEITVKNEDDEDVDGVIVAVNSDSLTIDFNHPLAGKTLTFEVSVVELREATEEELAHGHVHGDDDDDEFEFDEEYEDEEEYEDFEEGEDEEESGKDGRK